MSWTRVGVVVEVLSWVTRAQSAGLGDAPVGSQPVVDTTVRTLSCQIASVGRLSMMSEVERAAGLDRHRRVDEPRHHPGGRQVLLRRQGRATAAFVPVTVM